MLHLFISDNDERCGHVVDPPQALAKNYQHQEGKRKRQQRINGCCGLLIKGNPSCLAAVLMVLYQQTYLTANTALILSQII